MAKAKYTLIAAAAFSMFVLLGHLAVAYPAIRVGIIWIIILALAACLLFAITSFGAIYAAYFGSGRTSPRRTDYLMAVLPAGAALLSIILALVIGVIIGG